MLHSIKNKNIREIFNLKLKELRQKNHFTQKQIAEVLHMSQSSYSKTENATTLNSNVLTQVADFYNVTTDYILGRDNDHEEK